MRELEWALARAGYNRGTLDTIAKVTLDKDGDGFSITKSALELRASVPGISSEDFTRIANEAKAGCPVSKLMNAEITLTHSLAE